MFDVYDCRVDRLEPRALLGIIEGPERGWTNPLTLFGLIGGVAFLVAFIVMFIFLILLNIVFWWLPFLKICFPIPKMPSGGP